MPNLRWLGETPNDCYNPSWGSVQGRMVLVVEFKQDGYEVATISED